MNYKENISDNQVKDKRSLKKLLGIFVAAFFVVIVLAVGVVIYNSPVNKVSRQLDLGYKYLEKGEYEEAILAFEKAIAIDDKCMEAYAGGLKAYISIGDEESLQAFYDRALAATDNLNEELLKQNMGYVVVIYQMADTVYADMPEQAIEVLEKGWNVTAEPDIENRLTEKYWAIVEERNEAGNYEDALKIYDRLLELEQTDDRILKSLGKCLSAYLEFLLKEGRYDEVTTLIEKYRDVATGIDFEGFLTQIKEAIDTEERAEPIKESSEEKDKAETWGKDAQEEARIAPEQSMEEAEENGAELIDIENIADTSQSGNWVDDLYQKIVAEDADAVFAIMEEMDFIERCEMYPHIEVVWSVDYRLTTSEGYVFWVLKAIDYDGLYVTCTPNSTISEYEGIYEDINIAVAGEYNFSIIDGYKDWYKDEEGSDTYHA